METIRAVHQCLFCPQTFDTACEKDDHILEHFAQEICTDCDQKLVRIGSNLYTIHNAATCIKVDFKLEKSVEKQEINSGNYDENDFVSDPSYNSICHDDLDIKPDINELNTQILNTSHLPDDCDPELQNENDTETYHSNELVESPVDEGSVESSNENANENQCNICNKIFSSAYRLKKHKSTTHTPLGHFGCHICNNEKTVFLRKDSLRIHLQLKHDPNVVTFKCIYCCAFFLKKSSLDVHSLKCKKRIKKLGITAQFICNICRGVFRTEDELTVHKPVCLLRRRKQRVDCHKCGQSVLEVSLKNHILRQHPEDGAHICRHCLKSFSNEEELTKHQQNCDKIEMFECLICQMEFTFKGNLVRHMKMKHPNDSCSINDQNVQIPCHVCGKLMISNNLKKHILLKHHEPGTHICKHCVKIFPNEEELTNHLIKCNYVGEFECHICKKVFFLKGTLAKHVKIIHELKGGKKEPTVCDECGQLFETKNALKTHKRKEHNPPGLQKKKRSPHKRKQQKTLQNNTN